MEESKVKRAEWKICQADLMIGLFRERQLITELWKPANNARREAICIKDSGSIEERNSKVQISVLICICRNSPQKKGKQFVWFDLLAERNVSFSVLLEAFAHAELAALPDRKKLAFQLPEWAAGLSIRSARKTQNMTMTVK